MQLNTPNPPINNTSSHPKGMAGSVLFILIGILFLWWNETQVVLLHKSIKEGAGVAISIPSGNYTNQYEGRLVHMQGLAQNSDLLFDPDFGVGAHGLRLVRKSEMFQWVQISEDQLNKEQGKTKKQNISYRGQWLPELHSSENFEQADKYSNPTSMRWRQREWVAQNIQLGAFRIPSTLANKLDSSVDYGIPFQLEFPYHLRGQAHNLGSHIFVGTNPEQPQIGDMRISYQLVLNQSVTLLARQVGNSFEPYITTQGRELFSIRLGKYSPSEILQHLKMDASNERNWVVRTIGFLLLFLGLFGFFHNLMMWGKVAPRLRIFSAQGIRVHLWFTLPFALILGSFTLAFPWLSENLFYALALSLPAITIGLLLLWRGMPRKIVKTV